MADRGYDVTVLDRSTEMLTVAAQKGLRVALGDATSLPAKDASVDAVTMISMLHQVPDWPAALRKAQRVLEPGGTLVLLLYTAEHLRDHYFLDYFPTSRKRVGTDHVSLAEYPDALPGSRALPLHIRATDDLTPQIMRRHTHALPWTKHWPVRRATSPGSRPRTRWGSPKAGLGSGEISQPALSR